MTRRYDDGYYSPIERLLDVIKDQHKVGFCFFSGARACVCVRVCVSVCVESNADQVAR